MEDFALSVDVAEKVFTRYDGERVRVLQDLAFKAKPNELVVIAGLSGCGKSTLLNIIAGLDKDYRGAVTLSCKNNLKGNSKRNSLPLSYMFQESCLLPWRTVKDNVSLALQHPRGCEQAVLRLLNETGLAAVANNYPATLSVGMQRRVALVRAFIVDAPILLMDEPFSSLDESTAIHLRKLLLSRLHGSSAAGVKAAPRTVLFVTHNLNEALFLGSRLLVFSVPPTTLIGDIPLSSEVGLEGRSAEEIEKLSIEIKQQYPQIFGNIAQ